MLHSAHTASAAFGRQRHRKAPVYLRLLHLAGGATDWYEITEKHPAGAHPSLARRVMIYLVIIIIIIIIIVVVVVVVVVVTKCRMM